MHRWVVWALLLALPPAAQDEAKREPDFRILLATTDPMRGMRFQRFFEKHNIACTVKKYTQVTEELLEAHDMFMPDTPAGTFQEVRAAFKVDTRALPKTTKPVFGIATIGWRVLREYDIALGKIKT